VEVLTSSMNRCNITPPRSVEGFDEGDCRPPSPPMAQETCCSGDHRCSPLLPKYPFVASALPAPVSCRRQLLPAPGHANQKAEAERKTDGRKRPLRDDIFQRLLDRDGGILCRAQHRAAALGGVVERGIDVLAGLPVAVARLLAGLAGE